MRTFAEQLLNPADTPLVIAHRGASGYAHENTIEAFDLAIKQGADGIELDVRRTADGVLVVHHDATIAVRGRRRRISRLTFDQVRQAAQNRKKPFELITLEDALTFCRGKIGLDIELKEAGYEDTVVDVVLDHLQPSDAVFTSFVDRSVKRIKEYRPEVTAGLLLGFTVTNRLRGGLIEVFRHGRYRRCHADFLAPHHRLIRKAAMDRLHERGVPVVTYTVNNVRTARRLARWGVAGIIGNYPDRLIAALKS